MIKQGEPPSPSFTDFSKKLGVIILRRDLRTFSEASAPKVNENRFKFSVWHNAKAVNSPLPVTDDVPYLIIPFIAMD